MVLGIAIELCSFTWQAVVMIGQICIQSVSTLVTIVRYVMATPAATRKLSLLIPYALAVAIFGVAFQPVPQTFSDIVMAALTKAVPMVYLVMYVLFQGQHFHPGCIPLMRLKKMKFIVATSISLLFSCLSDMCSVADRHMHLGTLLFMMAHLTCIVGLNASLKSRDQVTWAYMLSSVVFYLKQFVLFWRLDDGDDLRRGGGICNYGKVLLLVLTPVLAIVTPGCTALYCILLLSHARLQVVSFCTNASISSLFGCISLLLLGLSSCSAVGSGETVLVLYYIAQGFLAASAVWFPSSSHEVMPLVK